MRKKDGHDRSAWLMSRTALGFLMPSLRQVGGLRRASRRSVETHLTGWRDYSTTRRRFRSHYWGCSPSVWVPCTRCSLGTARHWWLRPSSATTEVGGGGHC